MEFNESRFERKESEKSFEADMKVDFIRHGKPEYTEEEKTTAKFEGSLTDEAKEQITARALELAGSIDKEKEQVVFWVSPRKRAQQTAEILLQIFQEQNIPIIRNPKTIKSLSDTRMGPSFVQDLFKNNMIGKWMEYWAKADLPEDTEKPEEVKKRVARIITYLERIARRVILEENKKLHFICVGHEEIFRDLLEEGFDLSTESGTGPNYGEVMSVDIKKSEQGHDAILKLTFRGEQAELGFNTESREFYKQED